MISRSIGRGLEYGTGDGDLFLRTEPLRLRGDCDAFRSSRQFSGRAGDFDEVRLDLIGDFDGVPRLRLLGGAGDTLRSRRLVGCCGGGGEDDISLVMIRRGDGDRFLVTAWFCA